MVSRKFKSFFYRVTGPFMYLNGLLYKLFLSPNSGVVKVHLGPGQKNYLDGWINVDANIFTGKADIWADIRNNLPFRNNSVDFFYSHHVIEHLPDLSFHFQDMYRCLKNGGKIRIGGPNGDTSIKKFVENDLEWFGNFPDERKSIGGRFENYIFCRGEHLTILTESYLKELLINAGFSNIRICIATKETNYPYFIDKKVLETEWEKDFDNPATLMVEAEK